MIFVARTQVAAPAILTQPGLAGLAERTRAIANFGPGGPAAKFTYSVYSENDVKETLIRLFNKKCAYCESIITAVYYGDVEHFRPKGEITEAIAPTSPGYYWLASDWDNLMLACKFCNSQKYLKVYGSAVVELLGKLNQFPLYNFPHVRSHTVGIEAEEPYRLLINPCKDDPELLLSYGGDGNILPRKGLTGFLRAKGEKSIKVYGLQRIDLLDERKKMRIAIEMQQQRVLKTAKNFLRFLDADPELAAEFEADTMLEMQVLKDFRNPDRPYAGMAREMINDFLREQYDYILSKVV